MRRTWLAIVLAGCAQYLDFPADGGTSSDAAACTADAAACEAPPGPRCVGDALRTFTADACAGARCAYPFTDEPCPHGCSADACLGACEPIGPSITVIDSSTTVASPSIALDLAGGVHLAYHDVDADTLVYAFSSGGAFTREVVDAGGDHAALAVDDSGRAHVAYQRRVNLLEASLRYASRTSSAGWSDAPIDEQAGEDVGQFVSLAIDADGVPHVAYLHGGALELRHATGGLDGPWSVESVARALDEPFGPRTAPDQTSLAIDAAGRLHVAYFDASDGALAHATRGEGEAWSATAVETPPDRGRDCAIAIDADGAPHVSYRVHEAGESHLRFASRESDASWARADPDDRPHGGRQTSLALDAAGEPHIVHEANGVRYTRRHDGVWSSETLADENAFEVTMARAPDGTLHVLFVEVSRASLRYLRFRACP